MKAKPHDIIIPVFSLYDKKMTVRGIGPNKHQNKGVLKPAGYVFTKTKPDLDRPEIIDRIH